MRHSSFVALELRSKDLDSTSKAMSSRLQRQRGLKLSHIAKQLGVIPHTVPLIEVGASCHASPGLLVAAQAAKRP